MGLVAVVLFVTLFAFGHNYFGWEDPNGRVQLALASAFVFGIVCGFKVRE